MDPLYVNYDKRKNATSNSAVPTPTANTMPVFGAPATPAAPAPAPAAPAPDPTIPLASTPTHKLRISCFNSSFTFVVTDSLRFFSPFVVFQIFVILNKRILIDIKILKKFLSAKRL